MEDMYCFSFVMVYRLSSNNLPYSTSNKFLYVNQNLLRFLNIKQQFSFMNWFLCLSHVLLNQHWEKWNKKMSKNKRMSRLYKWLFIEGGFKSSAHYTMNYSVVAQIRYIHKFLSFFVLSAISLYCGWLSGHYLVSSLSHLMLITGQWECCNKFVS